MNWLVLLANLAFALITALGVQDADFFVASRQTQLPLVNVSIPTFSFFICAPILGAALYVYLHLHICKVTEALAKARPTTPNLEERMTPWLLNDFVLRRRKDRDQVIRRRPMDWLAGLATRGLVWWAGPVVLLLMWVRTWPAHSLLLSLVCAACMMISLYAGAMSWAKMQVDMGHRQARWTRITTMVITLLIVPVGWMTTANSKGFGALPITLPSTWPVAVISYTGEETGHLTNLQRIEKWAQEVPAGFDAPVSTRMAAWLWKAATGLLVLDPVNLEKAPLSVLPFEERDMDISIARYRIAFCERHTVSAIECLKFSEANGAAFQREWSEHRNALIRRIEKPNFHLRELRDGNFSDAELTGIDMTSALVSGARFAGSIMERVELRGAIARKADFGRADLRYATMQRAKLSESVFTNANLSDADLSGVEAQAAVFSGASMRSVPLDFASLEFADFDGADLTNAKLFNAPLIRANLRGATLISADLRRTKLAGADLRDATAAGALFWGAEITGADLRGADFKDASWEDAEVSSSVAHSADFRGGIGLGQQHLSGMIGDERTLLPPANLWAEGDDLYVPSCWETEPEDWATLVLAHSPRGMNTDRLRQTMTEDEMRAAFLCAPGEVPQKTGTPWPLDREPPWEEDPDWRPLDRGPVR
ncbi:pentapeptide repeat-containing protein [Paracoccus sp. (in: a-proteobacteria)]|uniref:pentapeptide repeat-containing protein n=1 Tax=Paracoccus sp. TaxID=267 RepID=UPI003A868CEF